MPTLTARPPRRLPEADQIARLLADVMTDDPRPAAEPVAPGTLPAGDRRVAAFFAAINWANAPRPAVPAADDPPDDDAPPVGGRRVKEFFAAVNWTNAPRPAAGDNPYLRPAAAGRPRADEPRTVSAVLDRFVWD